MNNPNPNNPDPNNPNPNPNPRPLYRGQQGEPKSWKAKIIGSIGILLIVASLAFLTWYLVLRSRQETSLEIPKPRSPEVSEMADQNAFSNGVGQITEQVEKSASNMNANMVKLSSELSQLVSSNQMVMSQRLDNLSAEMTSNNISIRAEIPGIVNGIVEEKLAKALESFQKLLILTNPPPAVTTVVTQVVTTLAPPPIVVAPAKPTVVTNNNLLVVNLPPPPQAPQPVSVTVTPTPASVVFQNNNTMVIGGVATASTNTAPPPYWLMKLW